MKRGWRRLAHAGRPRRVELIYDERYAVELPGTLHDPLRGERILAFLGDEGLVDARQVLRPELASYRDLLRVHGAEYLESLQRPGGLDRLLGMPLPEPLQERFLEAQRAATGGTVLAAQRALARRGAAVNLGGGFHHAFADRGARLCAYNDVAVALAERRAAGFTGRALVVDLDLHDPDGLRALLAADPAAHVFSLHARSAGESGPGATYVALGDGVDDAVYLDALRRHLPEVLARFPPDLAFFLAGADPAADDELGSWKLSAEALLERDRAVVAALPGVPLVVLLAGGYGPGAWRYPARSLAWLLGGRALEPPTTAETILRRYRRLTCAAGSRPEGEEWALRPDDLDAALGGLGPPPRRLLGAFSREALELLLERAGLLERLRARGFTRPTLDLEVGGPAGDTLRLWGDERRRELLLELRLARDRRTLPGFDLLRLEWLLLQDPRSPFTPQRPPLPGQRHPGLGLLQDVAALLILAGERLQLDGLVFVASHYHLASQGKRWLRFVDPAEEGRFRALQEALRGVPLAEATHAVASGRVVDAADGAPFVWRPAPMVLPLSAALRERVGGEEYEARAAAAAASHRPALRGGATA
ncbi:MAG TPA: histone deacetylase [Thermoanaerobaculia bacterium]